MVGTGDSCELRESPASYKGISGQDNEAIRLQNEYFLGKFCLNTI